MESVTVTTKPQPAPADLDALAEANRLREEHGLTQAQWAREMGIGASTASQLVSGTYPGSIADMAEKARAWIAHIEGRGRLGALTPDTFVCTPTAEEILSRLRLTDQTNTIGIVFGGAGCGKTKSMHAYASETAGRAVYIAITEPSKGVGPFLNRLAALLGLKLRHASRAALETAIVERLLDRPRMLLIDEIHIAERETLQTIRGIWDQTGCGVFLAGNLEGYQRLYGSKQQRESNAQIFSRVAQRLRIRAVKRGDLLALCSAWGIEAAEVIDFLAAVARHEGALRLVRHTVDLGLVMARGDRAKLTVPLLRAAFAQIDAAGVEDAA